jgi:hypothetical protein
VPSVGGMLARKMLRSCDTSPKHQKSPSEPGMSWKMLWRLPLDLL